VIDLAQATGQYLPMRGRWADIAALAGLQRRVAARLGDRAAELRSLMMLAAVHRERGEHDDAVRLLDAVVRGRAALGDDFRAGPALVHLGIAHARRGDLRDALHCFEAGADAYRRHDRRAGEGIARYEAGEVLLQLGDYPAALAALEASLALRRAGRDLVGEGITLFGLGKALCRLGRGGEATTLLTEALERCRRTGARDYEWQALLWRGEARRAGDRDGAVADLTEALRICRAVPNRRGEAYALRLLSRVWDERGDPRRAQTCRHRADGILARSAPVGGPVAPDDDWPAVQAAAPTVAAEPAVAVEPAGASTSAIRRSGPRRRSTR
jgi:tetratricopeptide (TPR) repeat protein